MPELLPPTSAEHTLDTSVSGKFQSDSEWEEVKKKKAKEMKKGKKTVKKEVKAKEK